jgi:large subunit ribosomal protein L10
LAKTRELKIQILDQYEGWLNRSQAMIVTEYTGLTMKDMDALRAKIREVGGEFHIVKNTLGRQTWEKAGVTFPQELLEGSTAVAFAFKDPPAMAKAILDFAKTNEKIKIKGGVLDRKAMSAEGVKSLAELPPLPVMRAQLLGTILAPASKLVRTLAEPGRQVASVIKAYSDRDSASAAA